MRREAIKIFFEDISHARRREGRSYFLAFVDDLVDFAEHVDSLCFLKVDGIASWFDFDLDDLLPSIAIGLGISPRELQSDGPPLSRKLSLSCYRLLEGISIQC